MGRRTPPFASLLTAMTWGLGKYMIQDGGFGWEKNGVLSPRVEGKPDLDTAGKESGIEVKHTVSERFPQCRPEIPETAKDFGNGVFQEASLLHQLTHGVGNLEEKIEVLNGNGVSTKRMFQPVASIFLDIESLILNFPS